MLSSIEGGIVTIDKNGRITTFNRSAEEITGYKAEEALDKECSQIIGNDLCKGECPLKEILETGKTCFKYEINITNKLGKVGTGNLFHQHGFQDENQCQLYKFSPDPFFLLPVSAGEGESKMKNGQTGEPGTNKKTGKPNRGKKVTKISQFQAPEKDIKQLKAYGAEWKKQHPFPGNRTFLVYCFVNQGYRVFPI
jgi:PAS domain S-box-containing protein